VRFFRLGEEGRLLTPSLGVYVSQTRQLPRLPPPLLYFFVPLLFSVGIYVSPTRQLPASPFYISSSLLTPSLLKFIYLNKIFKIKLLQRNIYFIQNRFKFIISMVQSIQSKINIIYKLLLKNA
jgi:hypothetical protein